jgi:hypothetical protein
LVEDLRFLLPVCLLRLERLLLPPLEGICGIATGGGTSFGIEAVGVDGALVIKFEVVIFNLYR